MRIKLSDLMAGANYSVQVRVKNQEEVSPWSKNFFFQTELDTHPPATPIGLVGSMSGTTFIVEWQPVTESTDGSPANDLDKYFVKVESPGAISTREYPVVGDSRFQFTLDMNRDLFGSPRAEITMSVRAVDKTGNTSPFSNTVTQTNPPPAAPTNLSGSELMDSVSLEWDEVDEDDLLGYVAYEGLTSGTQTTRVWSGPTTSALIPSTTYVTDKWYKVLAIDVFGTESLTGPVVGPLRPQSPFTVDSTPPGVPTGLAGTITTTVDRAALNVSWTNGANPDNDLAGTIIAYRSVGATDWAYTNVDYSVTSTRIDNLTPYVNYEIRARAYDWSANYSAWTNTVTTNTAATNTAPPTVTGVAITAGLDSVTVSWAESTADDVKNGAGVYLVQIATNNTFSTGLLEYRTGSTQISVTGLAQNQTYYARVKAVDSAGLQSASWSTVVNAGTGDYPEGNPFTYKTQATAPSSPYVGDIWMDTTSGFEKQWSGSAWVNTGNASITYVDGQTDNLVKNYVTEYSVNSSETVAPSTGWSTATPTRTPGTFIWYRVVVTYGDDTTSTTSPALLTGNTGATGSQGIPGEDGADGQSLYTWLKYADTPTTGMSDSPTGKTYIGLAYNKTTPTESSTYSDYAWSLIKGDQGIPGTPGDDGQSLYTWVKYATSDTGANMSDDPTGKTYIGLAYNKPTATESTTAGDYQWTLFQGPQGDQGIPGTPGDDGVSLYTWIKYADTPTTGMADTPDGKTYMGIAYNKTSATESTNYADYSWSLIKGADGTDGKGISNTVVNYAKSTNGTTAPSTGWGTAIPTTTTGEFLWTRTVTTYTDASTSTAYSVAAHGATGSTGATGVGVSGTAVTYQKSTNGTTAPTGTWTTTIPLTTTGEFLWTRTVTTYTNATTSTAYSVAAHGATGQQGIPGEPGTDGVTTYTWVKYADNSSGGGMSDSPTGKTYIGLAFNKTTPTESITTTDYAWSLIQGPQGTPAPIVSLTATTQVLTSPATGGATTPTTSVVTGTATNTTITVWQYSVDGAAFSNTVPTGASRSGNVVTITGSTMTAKTITVRMADANGVADTLTVAKVLDGATGATGDPGDPGLPGDPGDPGADAFTVLLTNESHTFPGSTTAALAGSTTTNVIAYEGSTLSNATIGTITGQVTGLTTSVTGSGTTNPTITITVTTSLTTKSGTLTIPVTVNGVAFTKRFSWSLALQGSQGIQGLPGDDGITYYTWLKYASSATPAPADMSDSPTGKTYMGIAVNKTSPTETTTYTDYTWSLIKGDQGIPGTPGDDGITYYTWIKYGTSAAGAGLSDDPTGRPYIGIAYNKTTATESTTPGDYTWSLIQGSSGSDGTDGVSITSVAPYYYQTTATASAPAKPTTTTPPAPWTLTEPAYSPNTALWRTERIGYSNGTFAYTNVNKDSSYAAAGSVQEWSLSRGTDLVTNGTGYLGTNYNFSSHFDANAIDVPNGASRSFYAKATNSHGAWIDELIPFDPSKSYRLSFKARQTVAGATNRLYGMLIPYDQWGAQISPQNYMFIADTTTTLAQPLSNGQTTITLTSSANWYGSAAKPAGGLTHFRSMIIWNWVDPNGKVWEPHTYSRNYWATNTWADGGVNGNVITLNAPWSGGSFPAGTPVSNGSSAGTYLYMPSVNNVVAPETWTQYGEIFSSGLMASADATTGRPGAAWATGMPPGTANVKVGWLLNYAPSPANATVGRHAVASVSFSDAAAANENAQTALAAANGKNKVVHSTTTPSSTVGYVDGDTWFRYDGSNNIIGQWRFISGGWVSEQIGSAVIANLDAGKLTANSAFITTLNIGSGGVIQSAGYTSGGTSGFQLSNTGLTIKGTGNVVDVGAVSAGTITAKTWNVGTGGVINVDSTGQIKSNNYAANSTGYKLSNSGLEINDGSIDAKALRTNTAIIGDLTIGRSADALGSIKSFGYVAGTTGWKLDKSGLELNTGSVSAAALKIQSGANLCPPQYSAFEFSSSFYTGKFFANGGTPSIQPTGGVIGGQYLRFAASAAAASSLIIADSATDYNVTIEPGKVYIVSAWMRRIGTTSVNAMLRFKFSNATYPTLSTTSISTSTWTRYSWEVLVPSGITSGALQLYNSSTISGAGVDVDGIQIEEKIGAISTPSTYSMPGTTSVDGAIVRTGEIRSNLTTTVNGTPMPNWSINMAGNMQVGDGLIRGKLLVGLSGDPDAGNSYISSGNFVTGSTGWKIDSAGNAELNNGTFRGVIDAAEFTGQNFISSGSIYAGNVLSNHTEISSTGLYVYTDTPNEGVIQTVKLGGSIDDYFALADSTGQQNATIGADGTASFTSLAVNEKTYNVDGVPEKGLFVYGKEFEEHFWERAWGVVAWGSRDTRLSTATTVETPFAEIQAQCKAGRLYKIATNQLTVQSSAADGRISTYLKYTSNGTTPGVSSSQISTSTVQCDNASVWYESPAHQKFISFSVDVDLRVVLTVKPAYTSYTANIIGNNGNGGAIIYIEDVGPYIPDTVIDRTDASPPPTKKTYTSTWVSNASESYDGSNSVRYNTSDLVQGDSGSSNGNSHGLILFTGSNSTGGQTGISVATAMTGATLNKAEVYLYANHWYYGSGGTAVIRGSTATSLSGFTPSAASKTVTGWARSSGKWVDITSIVGTNIRAVTVGKAPSSSLTYYGRFNAHNQSNPPKLRLTYTK
jgi:hypothetical protein